MFWEFYQKSSIETNDQKKEGTHISVVRIMHNTILCQHRPHTENKYLCKDYLCQILRVNQFYVILTAMRFCDFEWNMGIGVLKWITQSWREEIENNTKWEKRKREDGQFKQIPFEPMNNAMWFRMLIPVSKQEDLLLVPRLELILFRDLCERRVHMHRYKNELFVSWFAFLFTWCVA